MLFSNELQRRFTADGSHVLAVSVHPGALLETNLARHISVSGIVSTILALWWRRGGFYAAFFGTLFKTTKQGE